MAFQGLIVRVAWLVSAIVAIIMISNKLSHDDAGPSRQVIVVHEAPEAPEAPEAREAPRAPRPVRAVRIGSEAVIVAIAGVGDDERRVEGFTLTQPLDVRVLALGEGSGQELVDYGVILDAATRRPMWRMEASNTHHAGGAEKNRMVDEVVSLDAGDYLVYYMSDDSHSYGDWNSEPPSFPELWGITVAGAHGPPAGDVVHPYDDRDNDAVLARIAEVGDDQNWIERFTMDGAGDVRIYAIGEGDQSDMYDYATIKDASSGDVVWRMSYRETEHAGGGEKNRLFDGVISLQPGEYELVYQTDGSHSFDDWNVAAPHDPSSYGVTVLRH